MKRRREILEAAGGFGGADGGDDAGAVRRPRRSRHGPAESAPQHHIRFGVCGISHDHIHGMIGAIQRGGGELVSTGARSPDKLAVFAKRYPNAERLRSQDEVLADCLRCSW